MKDFSHLLITVWHLTPLSSPKNHLWQVIPCGLSRDSWGMPKKYSESRMSSWALSCLPTLTYSSYPYTHSAASLLFTVPLSHKYSTVSFSYWKENHNFKTGFEPHTQPQKLLKLCGTALFFVAPGWEEAMLWTACSVKEKHKITYCPAWNTLGANRLLIVTEPHSRTLHPGECCCPVFVSLSLILQPVWLPDGENSGSQPL